MASVTALGRHRFRTSITVMDSPVGIGLLSGEMILRGGCLPHPVVLCGLRELDGKVFAPLIKHKSNLYSFLTTAPLRKKKLGQCCVFDEMAVKRKVARMASVGEHAYDEVADGDVDLIGGLDLNTAPVDAAVQKSSRSKRRGVKVSRKIIPKFGSITLERVGLEPWTCTVIFDAGMNNHVFMEATLANFQNLFAFVQKEFDAFERVGGASRPKPQAVKAPRGSQGKREYLGASNKAVVNQKCRQRCQVWFSDPAAQRIGRQRTCSYFQGQGQDQSRAAQQASPLYK